MPPTTNLHLLPRSDDERFVAAIIAAGWPRAPYDYMPDPPRPRVERDPDDARDRWLDRRDERDDDADDCPTCGGSGGGPDAALRCRVCRGSGVR